MFLEYNIYSYCLIFLSIIFCLKNIKKFSKLFNLYDEPEKRKIHSTSVSKIGGLILYFTFLIAFYFNSLVIKSFDYDLLLFVTFFFIVGFVDDIKNIKSSYRMLIIIFFVLSFTFYNEDILLEKIILFDRTYYLDEFSNLLTVVSILLLYISLNMLDGIDGIMLINFILWILFLMIFYEVIKNNLLFFSLIFSSFILLILNLRKKLFIGNSGTAIIISLLSYFFIQYNQFEPKNAFFTISVLLIPGIDMIRLFAIRLIKNSNPLTPDKNHFHHILFFRYGIIPALFIYSSLLFSPFLLNKITFFKIEELTLLSVLIYIFLLYKTKNADS